jgi:hypothetical protein
MWTAPIATRRTGGTCTVRKTGLSVLLDETAFARAQPLQESLRERIGWRVAFTNQPLPASVEFRHENRGPAIRPLDIQCGQEREIHQRANRIS